MMNEGTTVSTVSERASQDLADDAPAHGCATDEGDRGGLETVTKRNKKVRGGKGVGVEERELEIAKQFVGHSPDPYRRPDVTREEAGDGEEDISEEMLLAYPSAPGW